MCYGMLLQCREAFERFDKDGSGSISIEELRNVISMLQLAPTKGEAEDMLRELDINKDGAVDMWEFCVYVQKQKDEGKTREEAEVIELGVGATKRSVGARELTVSIFARDGRIAGGCRLRAAPLLESWFIRVARRAARETSLAGVAASVAALLRLARHGQKGAARGLPLRQALQLVGELGAAGQVPVSAPKRRRAGGEVGDGLVNLYNEQMCSPRMPPHQ